MQKSFDLIILGAGVSGLAAAVAAGQNGVSVLVIDHADKAGRKLCIAGGGYANMSNRQVSHLNYLGNNPHFCKSILAGFTVTQLEEFIDDLEFDLEERDHGQLFLTRPAPELRNAMLDKALATGAKIFLEQRIISVSHDQDNPAGFTVTTDKDRYVAPKLLLALGSPAWPQCGASSFGAELLKKFGHKVIPFRPALVPLIMPSSWPLHGLQGISLPVRVSIEGKKVSYHLDLLFTHKGISGPAALQISSHWQTGETLEIDFLPGRQFKDLLQRARDKGGAQKLSNFCVGLLPQRLCQKLLPAKFMETRLAELPARALLEIENAIHRHQVIPSGNEGMRRAEAAIGGADTGQFASKDLQSKLLPGLYCAGELLDVTGELGGYNIHWALAGGLAVGGSVQVEKRASGA